MSAVYKFWIVFVAARCGGTSIFDRGKDLAKVKRGDVQFIRAKIKHGDG